MQKVGARGVDGTVKNLALVRRDEGMAYVCPIQCYAAVMSGDENSVVGFPEADIGAPTREIQV